MSKWLLTLLVATAGVWAQGRVIGTVTAADAAARNLSVRTDAGDLYAVKILAEAKLQRVAPGQTDLSKAEALEIGTLVAGDRVLVRGQQNDIEKTVLAAQVVVISKQALQSRDAERQQQWRANSVAGVVKTVDPLTVQARGNTVWTVQTDGLKSVHRYADDSSRFVNAKAAAIGDVQPGDQIRVLGEKDAANSVVKAAEVVFGRYSTLGGEIKSLNVTAETITLYDLTTKKNVTISISKEARMTRLPGFPGVPSPGAGPRGMGPNGPPAPSPRGPNDGPGRMGMGPPDPAMLLERLPPAKLSDLQVGDAVVLTIGKPQTKNPIALSLVAGLDFLLRAPAQQATQMIANWNIEGGLQ